jgi:hypothetical protein
MLLFLSFCDAGVAHCLPTGATHSLNQDGQPAARTPTHTPASRVVGEGGKGPHSFCCSWSHTGRLVRSVVTLDWWSCRGYHPCCCFACSAHTCSFVLSSPFSFCAAAAGCVSWVVSQSVGWFVVVVCFFVVSQVCVLTGVYWSVLLHTGWWSWMVM